MANARAKNRVLVTLWVHENLLAVIEEARSKKHEDRTRFLMMAAGERLRALGFEFDESWLYPEDRARFTRYPAPPAGSGYELNDKGTGYKAAPPSSTASDLESEAAKKIVKKAADLSKEKPPVDPPKGASAKPSARKPRDPVP